MFDAVKLGTCHIFCLHTSCSISINENADPHVRTDLQKVFGKIIPKIPYEHDYENSDDMKSHALTVICGSEFTIPIRDGKLLLGTWQGIYLNEHRKQGEDRKIVLTI